MSDELSFNRRYIELQAYSRKHKDCLVPAVNPDDPNYGLGLWVDTQRQEQRKFQRGDPSSTLDILKIAALERIGFAWDLPSANAEGKGTTTGVVSPEASRQSDHDRQSDIRKCSEESSDVSDEHNRAYSTKNNDSTEQSGDDEDHDRTLNLPKKDLFLLGLLKDHMASFYPDGGFVGDCKFENKDLGSWIKALRDKYHKNRLNKELVTELDNIGFLWEQEPAEASLDGLGDNGNASDAEATNYDSGYEGESSNGNPKSPTLRKSSSDDDDSDAESDSAVKHQYRTRRAAVDIDSDAESLSEEKYKEWDQNFTWLKRFMRVHHPKGGYVNCIRCPVERRRWVSQLRKQYHKHQEGERVELTAEQIQRLENIGFWWDKVEDKVQLEARSTVNKSKRKRKRRGLKSTWDRNFDKVVDFMKKHGIYKTGGYVDARWCKKSFSDWVVRQRDQYALKKLGLESDITNEQIKRLESIGFHWKLIDEVEHSGAVDTRKRKHTEDSIEDSKKMKFASPTKKSSRITWDEDFERLKDILNARPELRSRPYPISSSEDQRFYRWCYKQRYNCRQLIAGKESPMKEYQAQLLKDIGFLVEESVSALTSSGDHASDEDDYSASMSLKESTLQQQNNLTSPIMRRCGRVPWETNYKKLARLMKKYYPHGGFVMLPCGHELYNWVYNQRSLYRNEKLKDDRIIKLEHLGFLWEEPKGQERADEEAASSVATKQGSGSDSDDEDESGQEDEGSGGEPTSDQEDEQSSDEEEDESVPAPKHTSRRKSEMIPITKDLFQHQMHLAKMLRKENAELQKRNSELQTELQASEDKNEMLITKIREHQIQINLLRDEKSKLESKLHKYKAKLTKAKGRVKHLEKENETLRTDNEELRRSLKNSARREKKKRKHSK